jgi:hypothetical protein
VVKSIRLSKELNDYLDDEAHRSSLTVSSLVSQIISSYKNRYRHIEKLGSVSLMPNTFSRILTHVDDEELVKMGPSIASVLLMYNAHVLEGRRSIEGLEWCITKLMPSANWYNCYSTDNAYLISHHFGEKWSMFLMSFLSYMIESETGVKPSIKYEGEMIILDSFIKDRKNGKNGVYLNGKNGSIHISTST